MRFIFIFLVLTFCSCQATFPTTYKAEELKTISQNQLKGKFKITDFSYGKTIGFQLLKKKDQVQLQDSTAHAEFKLIYPNNIKISFFENNELVKSKILKGKFKGKYFEFKTQFSIPLFTGFFNIYNSTTSRIGILENGNLTMDTYGEGCGLLFICPIMCAEGFDLKMEFERIL